MSLAQGHRSEDLKKDQQQLTEPFVRRKMSSLAFSASLVATNKFRCRLPSRNAVLRCNLSEPLKFKDNGKPCIPVFGSEQATFPSFLASNYLERNAFNKNDTRLRIFSGTANPALSQTQGRESIAAKLVANLITEAGAERVLACDLHSGQSMGYFDILVDHVHGQPVICFNYLMHLWPLWIKSVMGTMLRRIPRADLEAKMKYLSNWVDARIGDGENVLKKPILFTYRSWLPFASKETRTA